MEKLSSNLIGDTTEISEEEAKLIDECIPIVTFPKGTVLLEEGKVATECYFSIKGCVRSYYIVDGEEKTTSFFTEGEAIASLNSYINKIPARHYFECVEDCTLAVLSYDKEKELCKRFPKFESLCRGSIEEDFAKQQDIMASYLTKSPEERYLDLQKNRPELLQRVPQYHLATYLGVKPESLSRIRRRIAEKT